MTPYATLRNEADHKKSLEAKTENNTVASEVEVIMEDNLEVPEETRKRKTKHAFSLLSANPCVLCFETIKQKMYLTLFCLRFIPQIIKQNNKSCFILTKGDCSEP